MPCKYRSNLVRFDPHTTDFNLAVNPASQHQQSTTVHKTKVAGAVEHVASILAAGVGNERSTLCRTVIDVTVRPVWRTDRDLPRAAKFKSLIARGEQIHFSSRNRHSNRQQANVRQILWHNMKALSKGGLGGAVEVDDDWRYLERLSPVVHQRRRKRISCKKSIAERGRALARALVPQPEPCQA